MRLLHQTIEEKPGHIGWAIRRARLRLRLTQEDLAHRCGLTLVALQHWEQGHVKSVLATQVERIAIHLNTTADALWADAVNGPEKMSHGRPRNH